MRSSARIACVLALAVIGIVSTVVGGVKAADAMTIRSAVSEEPLAAPGADCERLLSRTTHTAWRSAFAAGVAGAALVFPPNLPLLAIGLGGAIHSLGEASRAMSSAIRFGVCRAG